MWFLIVIVLLLICLFPIFLLPFAAAAISLGGVEKKPAPDLEALKDQYFKELLEDIARAEAAKVGGVSWWEYAASYFGKKIEQLTIDNIHNFDLVLNKTEFLHPNGRTATMLNYIDESQRAILLQNFYSEHNSLEAKLVQLKSDFVKMMQNNKIAVQIDADYKLYTDVMYKISKLKKNIPELINDIKEAAKGKLEVDREYIMGAYLLLTDTINQIYELTISKYPNGYQIFSTIYPPKKTLLNDSYEEIKKLREIIKPAIKSHTKLSYKQLLAAGILTMVAVKGLATNVNAFNPTNDNNIPGIQLTVPQSTSSIASYIPPAFPPLEPINFPQPSTAVMIPPSTDLEVYTPPQSSIEDTPQGSITQTSITAPHLTHYTPPSNQPSSSQLALPSPSSSNQPSSSQLALPSPSSSNQPSNQPSSSQLALPSPSSSDQPSSNQPSSSSLSPSTSPSSPSDVAQSNVTSSDVTPSDLSLQQQISEKSTVSAPYISAPAPVAVSYDIAPVAPTSYTITPAVPRTTVAISTLPQPSTALVSPAPPPSNVSIPVDVEPVTTFANQPVIKNVTVEQAQFAINAADPALLADIPLPPPPPPLPTRHMYVGNMTMVKTDVENDVYLFPPNVTDKYAVKEYDLSGQVALCPAGSKLSNNTLSIPNNKVPIIYSANGGTILTYTKGTVPLLRENHIKIPTFLILAVGTIVGRQIQKKHEPKPKPKSFEPILPDFSLLEDIEDTPKPAQDIKSEEEPEQDLNFDIYTGRILTGGLGQIKHTIIEKLNHIYRDSPDWDYYLQKIGNILGVSGSNSAIIAKINEVCAAIPMNSSSAYNPILRLREYFKTVVDIPTIEKFRTLLN